MRIISKRGLYYAQRKIMFMWFNNGSGYESKGQAEYWGVV